MSAEGNLRTAASARLLNFGCGGTFHPDWTNLDAAPLHPGIIAHDLRRGFPFPAESFDAAYGSHVLEHLEPEAGARLLRECYRILRPGGVVRLAVPDLEAITRLYLQSLEGVLAGDTDAATRYEWMMLELFDQATRTCSGGQMQQFLRRPLGASAAQFVATRVGPEAISGSVTEPARWPLLARLSRRGRAVADRVSTTLAAACARLFMGREGSAALHEGLFRRSGEVHRWMYDRYSIAQALGRAGFADARIRAADDSDIPGFARYGLETARGAPRKPDSLYVEARRARLT